jgi:hypothetical protein
MKSYKDAGIAWDNLPDNQSPLCSNKDGVLHMAHAEKKIHFFVQ